MKIPFYPYNKVFSSDREKYLDIFDKVSSKGAFIMQEELTNFEKNIAEMSNCDYAIGVGNATDALELILMASELPKGGEILFCSHTMMATASSIFVAGYKPVPVEVSDDHNISIEDIKKKINSRTIAIMPTHLNGRMANMDKIIEVGKKNNLYIIEDAAQALGARINQIKPGQVSLGACISFYPAKTLGCFGDGGCVLTSNKKIAEKIFKIRDHGRDVNGQITEWGRNSRLDNLQAAILDYKLTKYDDLISRRRVIAKQYNDTLEKYEFIYKPIFNDKDYSRFDVFQNYEIRIDQRDKFKNLLELEGIGTLIQWSGQAAHQHQIFKKIYNLTKTDNIINQSLMLPLNEYITDDEMDYILKKLTNILDGFNGK
jgi:dTDP-4-amino-4,6-dideoxygalactose transaminase